MSFGSLPAGVAVGTTDQATVTLDDDDGVVSLSSLSSQVGIQLTAELTDPSSRSGGTRGSRRSSSKAARQTAPGSALLDPPSPFIPHSIWHWQRRLSSTAAWATAPGSASQPDTWTSTYTPVEADVGYFLRATVRYASAVRPPRKTAHSSATEAVQAAPPPAPTHPPSFDADADPVAYSVQAGSTLNATLPAAEGADRYETPGTVPSYVTVNPTTRAISIQPENTHVGDDSFTWRARNSHGTDDVTVNITVTSLIETQYAYRASQTAPLFDAAGTPDHWSSSIITWTNAAPRVWRIRRTRPSGGTWSEWGTLEKYSERPAASATFYRRDSPPPSTPGTQTDITISTPNDWQTTQPTATATESVWRTTAKRAQGDTQWVFTASTQETPPTSGTPPGPPRNFAADTGSPLTPGSIALDWDAPDSGGTPTGYRVEYRFASGSWLLGATPTLTNVSLVLDRADALYQFQVRTENSAGTSGWVEATGTTSAPVPETETAYRRHTSGTTAPTFTASASTVPTGWFSSRQTPNPHA